MCSGLGSPLQDDRSSTAAWDPTASARLTIGTRSAIEQTATAIGDWSAVGVLIGARERHTTSRAAFIRDARATAGQRSGARSAVEHRTAAVADLAAFGIDRCTIASRATSSSALIWDSTAATGLAGRANAALLDTAATVANRSALGVRFFTGSRRTVSTTLARDPSTAANLWRFTGAAVDYAAAAVSNVATRGAGARAGSRSADAADAYAVKTCLPLGARAAGHRPAAAVSHEAAHCSATGHGYAGAAPARVRGAASATGFGFGAGAAVDCPAAPIGDRATLGTYLVTCPGNTRRTPADVGQPAAATHGWRLAVPTGEGATTTIRDNAAVCSLRAARGLCAGIAALIGDATSATGFRRRTGSALVHATAPVRHDATLGILLFAT